MPKKQPVEIKYEPLDGQFPFEPGDLIDVNLGEDGNSESVVRRSHQVNDTDVPPTQLVDVEIKGSVERCMLSEDGKGYAFKDQT